MLSSSGFWPTTVCQLQPHAYAADQMCKRNKAAWPLSDRMRYVLQYPPRSGMKKSELAVDVEAAWVWNCARDVQSAWVRNCARHAGLGW